jgi:phosphoadenosine phosphosulfate reductase
MSLSETNFEEIQRSLAEQSPQQVLSYAIGQFDRIALSFSGAEDVVLVDMAIKAAKKQHTQIEVFTLDTGRLHPETYQYLEQVRQHFAIPLTVLTPDQQELEPFVSEKGLFSFYQDGHQECCQIRKINPLKRKLRLLDAWITGQRRDQSPGTRSKVKTIEQDSLHGEQRALYKFNPLADWSSAQVWDYIKMLELPYNPLHSQGYTSIGCQPCTRAVLPNQHEREGRWWWEEPTIKECGLHKTAD